MGRFADALPDKPLGKEKVETPELDGIPHVWIHELTAGDFMEWATKLPEEPTPRQVNLGILAEVMRDDGGGTLTTFDELNKLADTPRLPTRLARRLYSKARLMNGLDEPEKN